jgi:hypothetical protein
MEEFLLTGLFGCFLIVVCSLNVYELLRYLWNQLPDMTLPPRLRVLAVVGAIFISHILNIWFFGAIYYLFHHYEIGNLSGPPIENGTFVVDIFTCMYYSAVIYTTLGLGDITPTGPLRMITNVESLTGFILIGWTVSFTYIAMIKFWELPHRKGKNNEP